MRVAMLLMYPGLPWQEDWCKAAATVADVVVIAPVARLSLPPLPGLPFAGRDPQDPHRYEVVKLHWRPSRLLGQVAHRVTARRIREVLGREAAECGPLDLLHAHTYYAADHLPWLGRASGLPYVVTEHDPAWYGHPSRPVPGRPALRRTARLYEGSAAVIAVSDSLRDALRALGMPGRVRVVPNPVDTGALPPLPARSRIGQDPVRIVSAGRLAPQKGYDVLLDAFATARAKDSRLRLRIIGEGRLRPELQERIRRLGLVGTVDLLGHLDRAAMLHEMAHADLFATASNAESFCVVALEAQCCGLPLVATRTGALPELAADGGGVTVAPEHPEALAQALLHVADTLGSYDRAALSERGRRGYGLESVGQRLAEVYRTVGADQFLP
ncbi:glycosyltransferase family 4 protein [Wenjunlia tyrosinilytica]|uniref:D-inositol 3-phosphate glycosyltransferase n=1 Tax=Wenjunlia tyrosinilytica TaxID=1544741 RepID=A0A918E1H6_9ACTN|nr:glycosyltransferase family 4 protein [Wenjunlia tyrosinilytica]GGO96174.1 glycosyl transferase [Wenjunlia tyrosinilytica]